MDNEDPTFLTKAAVTVDSGSLAFPTGAVKSFKSLADDAKYIVNDCANLTVTSSNQKAADVIGDVELVPGAELELTGNAVGSVTFTVVPNNTGVKKTVSLNLKTATFNNTATEKDYHSL